MFIYINIYLYREQRAYGNCKALRLRMHFTWHLSLIKVEHHLSYIISNQAQIADVCQLPGKSILLIFVNRKQQAVDELRHVKVIGMTTTGAAKYQDVLQRVKPRVIIVEEAAEVLEAHIISSLNTSCQHLILIGE